MTTITINDEIYNGLKIVGKEQHRSVSNLVEYILIRWGIPKVSSKDLERRLKDANVIHTPCTAKEAI
ncbi:MAG: hypothetical protein ACPKPY_04380 [Nitrososphaeraceae archaeon]